MLRFSLRSMLFTVAFVTFLATALMYPSPWLVIVSQTLFAILMGFAISKAVLCTGRNRAFWMCFCVSGLAFLVTTTDSRWQDVWRLHVGLPVFNRLPVADRVRPKPVKTAEGVTMIVGPSIKLGPGPAVSQRTREIDNLSLPLNMLAAVAVSTVAAWGCYFVVRDERGN